MAMHSYISCTLRVSLLAFFLACPSVSAEQSFNSAYDKPFNYQCSPGKVLRSITSHHSNRREDRVYTIACDNLPSYLSTYATERCQWSGYVNEFDQRMVYQCPGNGYVNGLGSYHSNRHEDRRYKFYCCTLPNTQIQDCSYSDWLNDFDDPLAFFLPAGRVLRGMVSYHSNHHEDRRFKFNVCTLAEQ